MERWGWEWGSRGPTERQGRTHRRVCQVGILEKRRGIVDIGVGAYIYKGRGAAPQHRIHQGGSRTGWW